MATDPELIDGLFLRSEETLAELARQYEPLCTRVLRRILTQETDVEECCNDVWLALWNAIPPERPSSLPAFITTVARRIGINRYTYSRREKRNTAYDVSLSELAAELGEPSEDPSDDGELDRALGEFLSSLDAEGRRLFLRRYVYFDSIEELALRFGLRENTVSARLYRMRRSLRKFLLKEGIRI